MINNIDSENKTIAYLRISTDKQDLNNQKLEILEYCQKHNFKISEFIEATISSRRDNKYRRIEELLEKLQDSDTLIITELSRLGRSTNEVLSLINTLVTSNIRVIIIKQGLDINAHTMQSKVMITLFSLFAELERDLISLRTKEALAAKKASGQVLGKPKGTVQKSKFDAELPKIQMLLNYGLSKRKIAKALNLTNHISLSNYIKKRQIKAQ